MASNPLRVSVASLLRNKGTSSPEKRSPCSEGGGAIPVGGQEEIMLPVEKPPDPQPAQPAQFPPWYGDEYAWAKTGAGNRQIQLVPDHGATRSRLDEGVPFGVGREIGERFPDPVGRGSDTDGSSKMIGHFPCFFTKLGASFPTPVDLHQERWPARIRLSVSGVIPSMEARYCRGTRLNKSGCSVKRAS